MGSTTGKIHLGRYLDLFPSLGNLEEETSCSCDVRQSSLCVLGGALHHDLTARKCFQLKDKKKRERCNNLWKHWYWFTATNEDACMCCLRCVIMQMFNMRFNNVAGGDMLTYRCWVTRRPRRSWRSRRTSGANNRHGWENNNVKTCFYCDIFSFYRTHLFIFAPTGSIIKCFHSTSSSCLIPSATRTRCKLLPASLQQYLLDELYLNHILMVMKGVLEAPVAQVDRSVLLSPNLGYLVLQGGLVAPSWSLLWGPERGSYQ